LLPRYNFDCQSLPFDFAAQARHRHPAERKCDLHCVTQTQWCVEVDTVGLYHKASVLRQRFKPKDRGFQSKVMPVGADLPSAL
jgi:hypothetical protein